MEKNSSPLSPHLQIYKWQFSSLLSITHRMTGVFNVGGFFLIVLWVLFLATGPEYYNFYQKFLKSLVGKFILVGFTWSFVYHMLNGIRHLAWDFGYGYEIKTANLSGVVVLLFIYSNNIFYLDYIMKNHALNKWLIQRVSAIVLIPLLLFLLYSLVDLVNQDYTGALDFFDSYLSIVIFTLFLIFAGTHLKLGLGEIIEDYIQQENMKNILNRIIMLTSAILPLVGIVSLTIIIL